VSQQKGILMNELGLTKRPERWIQRAITGIAMSGLILAPEAYAGLAAGTTMLTTIVTWLNGFAILITTVAIMWTGYKVMFKHAQFTDVAAILIGGLLIGGAAAIAAILVAP